MRKCPIDCALVTQAKKCRCFDVCKSAQVSANTAQVVIVTPLKPEKNALQRSWCVSFGLNKPTK